MDITEQFAQKLGKRFEENHGRRLAEATKRQIEIARSNRDNRKSMDGVGRPVMELDTHAANEVRAKYGRDIFKDKDFRKWYLKNNPEAAIKASGTKIQVGYR